MEVINVATKVKRMVAAVAFMVIGIAIFSSSASAECGPGFSSKQQLIHYYQNNPSAAHGFRKELLAHSAYTGYQADETVINWLRSPEQKVFNAPSGYRLTSNTFCPGGPGHYAPYNGLLNNMGGRPMLWHCDKEGNNCVPILKGYCMNFVMGPPVKKHHHHPCRRCHHHPHHPCKCHHKHKKPKKPPSCEAQGLVTVAGNCVSQSNSARQECEAKVGGTWNGNQCTIVQINANCSNVTVIEGSNNTVTQGGNCNTTVEEKPCSCEPQTEPPVVHLETIQELEANEVRTICAHVDPPNGDPVTVHFEAEYGTFANSGTGTQIPGSDRYCASYKAPSEPPHNATHCDLIEVLVQDTKTGSSAIDKKSVEVKPETPF